MTAKTELLTLQEAAERLSLSYAMVRRLIERGELNVHRIGRAVRISNVEVERFIESVSADE